MPCVKKFIGGAQTSQRRNDSVIIDYFAGRRSRSCFGRSTDSPSSQGSFGARSSALFARKLRPRSLRSRCCRFPSRRPIDVGSTSRCSTAWTSSSQRRSWRETIAGIALSISRYMITDHLEQELSSMSPAPPDVEALLPRPTTPRLPGSHYTPRISADDRLSGNSSSSSISRDSPRRAASRRR